MKFQSIEILNWGPYQAMDPILLDSTASSPMVLIYGNNGSGKTSFFHALYFVLYGEDKANFTLEKYANLIKVHEGEEFDVRVTLKYEVDDSNVELIRGFKAIPVRNTPGTVLIDGKYVQMRVNGGNPINEKSVDSFVRKDLPQEIAKFFLFDGEELDKIEKVLNSNTPGSRLPLKDGIESILGLPSLMQLNGEVTRILNDVDKVLEKESKNFASDKENKNKLDETDSQIAVKERDFETFQNKYRELEEENNRILNELQESESLTQDVGEIKAFKIQRAQLVQDLEDEQLKMRLILDSAWALPIADLILRKTTEYEDRLHSSLNLRNDEIRINQEISALKKQIETKICSGCGQKVDISESEILSKIEVLDSDLSKVLNESKNVSGKLIHPVWKSLSSSVNSRLTQLRDTDQNIRKSQYRLSEIDSEIAKLENRLKNVDQNVLIEKVSRRDINAETMRDCSENISKLVVDLLDLKKSRQRIKAKIVNASDVDPRIRLKLRYLEQLEEIVETTIIEFRTLIRVRVEKKASEHYVDIMNNDDILGLSISSDYKVSILHKEIGSKPGSKGQSLIFVYALIGALIDISGNGSSWVIDTPIARLDTTNSAEVWKWLAKRERQVIVLPQDKEIDPATASSLLAGKISREYEIRPLRPDSWSEIRPLIRKQK
jgi:DNA sulfur modification protein DndD